MNATETWHGTPSGYRCHGCRCTSCTAAHNDRQAYWYRLKGYGTWTPMVDAEPARQHINMLRSYGIGVLRVAKLADVNRSVIQKIVYSHQGRPPQRRVRENIARKILAVQPSFDHLADHAIIPGTGTTRRIQALVRIGWPAAELALRLQVHRRRVDQILSADRVTVKSARTIKALYEELWNQDPLNHGVAEHEKARAISRGQANEWPPPAAWDDDEIDDPDAQTGRGEVLNFHERAQLRREEIEHLAWCGHTPEQILDRLGGEVSISTVRQIVAEWRAGVKRDRKQVAA
ncbi:hypothetical protein GTY41_02440 [Streptomyces sp. SID685]|uniref:hypothetical protein n=1 Tax=Streptomyces sp. SID685 TaxID=2690322 RepID=UPI00136DAF31|nr:hypothetical protein [Streptomyces sp. SID685]MYR83833.1 hypothetical protein [Streptomyces sp. SID685]